MCLKGMLLLLLMISIRTYGSADTLTRENDSLVLVEFREQNPALVELWDIDEPLEQWDGITINSNRVLYLRLRNRGIDTLPPSIGLLSKLALLDLDFNNISHIPSEFCQLTKLHTLSLSFNSLTTLPEEISNMSELVNLSINSNNISELPSSFWNLTNLQTFYAFGNSIDYISEDIVNLENLIAISLGANNLSSLPESFFSLSNLKIVRLMDNNIATLPENITNLDLSEFDISSNKLNKNLLSSDVIAWLDTNATDWEKSQKSPTSLINSNSKSNEFTLIKDGNNLFFSKSFDLNTPIKILNLSGQVVMEGIINGNNFLLGSNLSKGFYLAVIKTPEITKEIKFMKK